MSADRMIDIFMSVMAGCLAIVTVLGTIWIAVHIIKDLI